MEALGVGGGGDGRGGGARALHDATAVAAEPIQPAHRPRACEKASGQCLPISLALTATRGPRRFLCRVLSALPLPHISDLAPSHPLLTGPERSRSPNLSVLEALARKALADDGTEPAE